MREGDEFCQLEFYMVEKGQKQKRKAEEGMEEKAFKRGKNGHRESDQEGDGQTERRKVKREGGLGNWSLKDALYVVAVSDIYCCCCWLMLAAAAVWQLQILFTSSHENDKKNKRSKERKKLEESLEKGPFVKILRYLRGHLCLLVYKWHTFGAVWYFFSFFFSSFDGEILFST